MTPKIYHNPRCSKSRATLALLEEHGQTPEIVEYLKDPPNRKEIVTLLKSLGLSARDIVRSKEVEFRESGLTLDSSEDELIDLIVRQPKILERPIVVLGSEARIGRPPERVLDLFE